MRTATTKNYWDQLLSMTCSSIPVHEKVGYIVDLSNYVNDFQSGALEPLGPNYFCKNMNCLFQCMDTWTKGMHTMVCKTAGTLAQIKAMTQTILIVFFSTMHWRCLKDKEKGILLKSICEEVLLLNLKSLHRSF